MIGKKVNGSGRLPNRILMCGEGPGVTESNTGIPFSGASGAELDYLYLKRAAGLRREDVYVTNLVKWRTDENDSDPSPEDIARDEEELLAEIEVCSPEIIVAVGKVAAQWFLQRTSVDMEKIHGCAIPCPRFPNKTLICAYHPAAAMRAADRYLHLIYWDFQQVGERFRRDDFEWWVENTRRQAKAVDVHYGVLCL